MLALNEDSKMREQIIIRHNKRGKCGRKPIPFTPEKMALVVRLTKQGLRHDEIAEYVGMAPATLFRKIAENKEYQKALWAIRRRLPTPYTKRDTEFWNELAVRGAESRRLRKIKSWRKFQLMIDKNMTYSQTINAIENMLEPKWYPPDY